jgi:hypothetical protein
MNDQTLTEMESIAKRWASFTTDEWNTQYIGQEVQLWKDLCEGLGVEYNSREFRAAALVLFSWLLQLLSEEQDQPLEIPMVQPTLRAVITSLVYGVFGSEFHPTEGDKT